MTVDLRAVVTCDLGNCISGDLSNNHISDRSGLVMTQGRIVIDGIVSPARGTPVNMLVAIQQRNIVTRFPKPLRVIRAVPNVIDRTTEVEVGCKLTLMKNKRDPLIYFPGQHIPSTGFDDASLVAVPIFAQKVLEFCLDKIRLQLAPTSRPLEFGFLRAGIDLSGGYVQVIGDLIRSECCFGRILPNERFEVVPLNIARGRRGPVLNQNSLVSHEAITTGSEPADNYRVTYKAAER